MTLPTIMTKNGLLPQTALALRAELLTEVAATNPGYTANLPGSLIEDISSTDVAALAICDSARVELVNSISPYGANEFLLNQLGQIYGVQRGEATNTSVYVVFSGTPGFVIVKGFTVSDGSHQYVVQEGGIISSTGDTTLFCVATAEGIWAIPANTVNQIITSVPSSITLAVNNPSAGTESQAEEGLDSYRSRVLQSGMAIAQGMPSLLKTLLANIPGVQSRLISVRQLSGEWEIICGGGDPYQVAYAIYTALFNISDLTGSVTTDRNITVTINDYPDQYTIVFVNPPVQNVGINVTWNTTATNIISDDTIKSLGTEALVNYVNGLAVGYAINIFDAQTIFIQAIQSAIPAQFVSRLIFDVYIDSVLTPPESGTGLVVGDPEGYFLTNAIAIVVARG